MFGQPDHDDVFRSAVFAELDKSVVGMGSSFTAEQRYRCSDQPSKQAAGYRALRMMCLGALAAPLLRALNTIADGDFYSEAIAVDKE